MTQFFFFVCLLLSSIAGACEAPEAQFVGRVKNHIETQRSEGASECTFEIEFSNFNPSAACPLEMDEVVSYPFQDPTCSQRENAPISGVIARHGPFFVIE